MVKHFCNAKLKGLDDDSSSEDSSSEDFSVIDEPDTETENNTTNGHIHHAVTNYYHIGICGQVSTGKSTCLNALTGQYLSQISLKRSTKRVLKFFHTDVNFKNKHKPTDIKNIIEKINSNDSHDETTFHVHMPLCDNKNNIVLYDFPGFNDGQESIQGMEKLFIDEMINLDLIIFIVDSNSALIHKSEKDIFKMLAEQLKKNHEKSRYTKLIVAFNKFHIDGDEIHDEINKDLMDIIKDAKTCIDETMSKLNANIDYSYTYVSFRNMMIYNIFDNQGNIDDISYTEFNQVLIEFYGKREAMKKLEALKRNKIHKQDLDCINLTSHEKQFTEQIKTLSNFQNHTSYWLSTLKHLVSKQINLDKMIQHDDTTIKYSTYDRCIEIFNGHSHYQRYNKKAFNGLVYDTMLHHNMSILSQTCLIHKSPCGSKTGLLYLDVLDNVLFIMEQFSMIEKPTGPDSKHQLPDNVVDVILGILKNFTYFEFNYDVSWYNRTAVSVLFRLIIMFTNDPVNYLLYFTEPWFVVLYHKACPKRGHLGSGTHDPMWEPKSVHVKEVLNNHKDYLERLHETLYTTIKLENTGEDSVLAKQCVQAFMVYYNASFTLASMKFNDNGHVTGMNECTIGCKMIRLHSAYIAYKHKINTGCYSINNVPISDQYNEILNLMADDNDGNYWDGLFETNLELVQFVRYCHQNSILPDNIIMDINLYINEQLLMLLG